jgi:Family of unknown function (DUF6318)
MLTTVVAAGALTLAACGSSGGGSDTLPSRSAPASTSARSTTASSNPPGTGPGGVPIPQPGAAAAQHSAAGAKAFAEYYTRLLDYTYATRDVKPLRDASDPGCILCQGTADDVSKFAKPGYRWSGGRFTLKGVSIAQPSRDQVIATVDISISELIVIDPNGKRDPYSEAATPVAQLKITENWAGDHWNPVDLLVGH